MLRMGESGGLIKLCHLEFLFVWWRPYLSISKATQVQRLIKFFVPQVESRWLQCRACGNVFFCNSILNISIFCSFVLLSSWITLKPSKSDAQANGSVEEWRVVEAREGDTLNEMRTIHTESISVLQASGGQTSWLQHPPCGFPRQ